MCTCLLQFLLEADMCIDVQLYVCEEAKGHESKIKPVRLGRAIEGVHLTKPIFSAEKFENATLQDLAADVGGWLRWLWPKYKDTAKQDRFRKAVAMKVMYSLRCTIGYRYSCITHFNNPAQVYLIPILACQIKQLSCMLTRLHNRK